MKKEYYKNEGIPELSQLLVAATKEEKVNQANERKSLTWDLRHKIFKDVIQDYSMLKKDKGIFHSQLMHAMDEYLRLCNETGYKIIF